MNRLEDPAWHKEQADVYTKKANEHETAVAENQIQANRCRRLASQYLAEANRLLKELEGGMTQNDEDYEITREVMEQYEAIRASGITNMYDRLTVASVANRLDFDALSDIAYDEKSYRHLLMNFGRYMAKYEINQKKGGT